MADRNPLFRLPMTYLQVCDTGRVRHAFRFTFQLEIRREDGKFVWHPFRLDTGTDFMTIPQWMANKFRIPFASNFPTRPNTGMGRASEDFYFGRACYSFPELSDWQFEVDCSFSPYANLEYCLFSLNDFVPHFIVSSDKASARFPYGSVAFRLRHDHGGKRRRPSKWG